MISEEEVIKLARESDEEARRGVQAFGWLTIITIVIVALLIYNFA
jgi:hypothetical protein